MASDIQKVVRSGRRHRTNALIISWLPNGLKQPRLGVVVARFGNTAVARNRLRRQLRDIARRSLLPFLLPIDLVIRATPSAYRSSFTELRAELENWLATYRDSLVGQHT